MTSVEPSLADSRPPAPDSASARPVLVATLFLLAVTNIPYLRAGLAPPAGMTFLGVFFSIPDVYNYLSYVQQAEDGTFFFVNKLVTDPHPPALVNLEWWAVGRLSGAIGRHPIVAYRVLGALATLALVAAADRLMRWGGLRDGHRLPALLLVFTGAGLGGIRYEVFGPPAWRSLDLVTGLYPFVGILVNPHFVLGTALMLWALLALAEARTWRGSLVGVLLGTILGLSRPYDVVLLVGIRVAVVLWTESPRAWIARLAPLLGLGPVALWNYWLFFRNPSFAVFTSMQPQPLGDILLALAPAALLAMLAFGGRTARHDTERTARVHLVAWIAAGALILVCPVSFSLQFLVSFGLPFLALGALGLARFPAAATATAALAYGTTAAVALRILLLGSSTWLVPRATMDAALALRPHCKPNDLLFSPANIGLYAIAYTACKAYVSHGAMRDFEEREAQVRSFYTGMTPASRAGLLDRLGVTHVVLPGSPGTTPEAWLGQGSRFRLLAEVGEPPFRMSLYGGTLSPMAPPGLATLP